MKKTLKCLSLTFSLVVGSLFIGAALPQKANAATGDTITFKKNVIAYEAANSTYNFIPTGNAADNRRALNYLIEGNEPKTINVILITLLKSIEPICPSLNKNLFPRYELIIQRLITERIFPKKKLKNVINAFFIFCECETI